MPSSVYAFAMATGAVSIGMHLAGFTWISNVTWVIASIGLVVITIAFLVRFFVGPKQMRQQLDSGSGSFGFFTVSAGMAVVGIRFTVGGMWTIGFILWIIAVATWLITTYLIPWRVIVTAHRIDAKVPETSAEQRKAGQGLLQDVNGGWFLWTTAAQGVAVLSAILATDLPAPAQDVFITFALISWAAGLFQYLVSGVLVVVRIVRFGVPVRELGASFWVVMGSLAISGLAGGRLAMLEHPGHLAAAVAPVGAATVLIVWGFITWALVGLLLLGIWKYVFLRESAWFKVELWSLVFPLGVYSTVSMTAGAVAHSAIPTGFGHVVIWFALVAWVFVVSDALVALARHKTPEPYLASQGPLVASAETPKQSA